MKKEEALLIKYLVAVIIIFLAMYILKPFFAFKPEDFLSVKALHSVGLMLRGTIFFGIFFGVSAVLISLMLNLNTKLKYLSLLLIIFPFSFYYKSLVGISFASGFLLALLLLIQFPPKLLIEDYKSFVSAIQFYNKSLIWKTYSFMFLFIILFSILSHINYIDPILTNVEKLTLEFTSGDVGKEIIAKTISEQTGTQIDADELSKEFLDQAKDQMKDMSSGMFKQARSVIEAFPAANLIATIVIAGVVNASYFLAFLFALLVSFLFTLVLGNKVSKNYLNESNLKPSNELNAQNYSTDTIKSQPSAQNLNQDSSQIASQTSNSSLQSETNNVQEQLATQSISNDSPNINNEELKESNANAQNNVNDFENQLKSEVKNKLNQELNNK